MKFFTDHEKATIYNEWVGRVTQKKLADKWGTSEKSMSMLIYREEKKREKEKAKS